MSDVREEVEQGCRFVFKQGGGRYGLTTDPELAGKARRAFIPATHYVRDPESGLDEWEINLSAANVVPLRT